MKVYIIGPAEGPYKVGIARDPKKRLEMLQIGSHQTLLIHAIRRCGSREEAVAVEAAAHTALKSERLRGEWFACSLESAQSAVGADDAADNDDGRPYDQDRWDEVYQVILSLMRLVPPEKLPMLAEIIGATEATPEAIAAARANKVARTGY